MQHITSVYLTDHVHVILLSVVVVTFSNAQAERCTTKALLIHLQRVLHHFLQAHRNNSVQVVAASGSNVHSGSHPRGSCHPQSSGD